MKTFNIEFSETITTIYSAEVNAENEEEARNIIYNGFWELDYNEEDSISEDITIITVEDITE